MKYLMWLWRLLTCPVWAWDTLRYSALNPANSDKAHSKRFEEYQRHVLPVEEVIQRVCGASQEQVVGVFHDWGRYHTGIEGEDIPESRLWTSDGRTPRRKVAIWYSIVRLTQPSIVVETGVARGNSTRNILRALEENAHGHLYSIELPRLEPRARDAVGTLVPASFRSKWSLIFGPGEREMKKLASSYKVDVFIHDSNHSYLNQRAEFRTALRWLEKGGILLSDDVVNDALLEASEEFNAELFVCQWTNGFLGFIVKQ